VSNRSVDKALTFGVKSLYTDVAGVLGALVVPLAALGSFAIQLSTNLLVVGGVGWIPGRYSGAPSCCSRPICPGKSPKDYPMRPGGC
jgi:hypothetical protein